MSREVTGFVKPMILVLYIAAARAAATNDQVIRLRSIGPNLERYRRHEIDEDRVMDLVDEVMGGPWDLPEDFSDQLVALGFTRGETGK